MKSTMHTPGPWKWDGYSLRPENPNPDAHAVHTILEVDTFAYGFVDSDLAATTAECAANRALIEAAPVMLDTLHMALFLIESGAPDRAAQTIREAIGARETKVGAGGTAPMPSRPFPNVKRHPGGVEDCGIGTHKYDGISIIGACDSHLDTRGCSGIGSNLDLVHPASHAVDGDGSTERVNTGLAVCADGVAGEVGHDDRNGNPLAAGIDDGDREGGAPVVMKWPGSSCHKNSPCKTEPIDWSALSGRLVKIHYDMADKSPQPAHMPHSLYNEPEGE